MTTNDGIFAEALRRFRNHGIRSRPERGGWYYEVEDEGANCRITDLQAALGTSQLGKLDRFVERRRALARRYGDLLAGLPVRLAPDAPPGFEHAWHLYAVRVADRRRVYDELRAGGIGVQVHYVPIYRHPRFGAPALPHTEAAYEELLSLPLFPDLTEGEQDEVAARLARAVRGS